MPATVPISATYLNVQIARVSAILLAAGAWDATPLELACPYFDFVSLAFTYTRGGVAGAFDWQLWTSLYSVAANAPAGAQEWHAPPIYASGAVAAGADTQSLVQDEYLTYTPIDVAVHSFNYGPVPLRGTIERIYVAARESGNAGAPGTLQITAEFS